MQKRSAAAIFSNTNEDRVTVLFTKDLIQWSLRVQCTRSDSDVSTMHWVHCSTNFKDNSFSDALLLRVVVVKCIDRLKFFFYWL